MALSLIFDMDGTLFQTDTILEISLQDTFQHLKAKNVWTGDTPLQKYREIMGVPLPVVWETLLPDHTLNVRKEANDIFQDRLIQNIQSGRGSLYPFTEEVLEFLKNSGAAIYVASNGQIDYLKAIIKQFHLDNWISETFSIQQIDSQSKSDLVRMIVNKYNIKEGIVIGDRLSDINAAKGNGLVAIGCNFDYAQEEELAQSDVVISSLLELKNISRLKKKLSHIY